MSCYFSVNSTPQRQFGLHEQVRRRHPPDRLCSPEHIKRILAMNSSKNQQFNAHSVNNFYASLTYTHSLTQHAPCMRHHAEPRRQYAHTNLPSPNHIAVQQVTCNINTDLDTAAASTRHSHVVNIDLNRPAIILHSLPALCTPDSIGDIGAILTAMLRRAFSVTGCYGICF